MRTERSQGIGIMYTAMQMLRKVSGSGWSRRWLFRHGSTAQILLIDTSFASLILDGELWNTSPADYCRYRPEVLYQILLASVKKSGNEAISLPILNPRDVVFEDNINLRRSLMAHEWAASLQDPSTRWKGDLRITPTVLMELSRAQQVMLMFNNIIVWHSDARNFSMQYKDGIWCSINKFFKKERGRTVKNFEVDKILDRFRNKLEERQGQLRAEDDQEGIVIDNALSGLEPPKTSSRPAIFTDVKIYAEGTAPGLANYFLVTNDSHFYEVVANRVIEELFTLAVQEALGVLMVPKITLAETIVNGM